MNARRRPSPGPATSTSRKRGWESAFVEHSLSSNLDTPGKNRDMGPAHIDDLHEAELMASDIDMPPPAKRRRGLAGSIVSTALSAALIGTAVGLTVYRLWRDRGREPERIAPPPYSQGEWTPEAPTPSLQITSPPPTRPRKSRHAVGSVGKRTTLHSAHVLHPHTHRRPRTVRGGVHPSTPAPPVVSPFPSPQPEFNFEDPDPSAVDTQMDWIGDKLSMLIEEGKKALNREIVIMSDSKEDEIDDGSGAWEEEEEQSQHARPTSTPSISRSSSTKLLRRPAISHTNNNTFDSPRGFPSSSSLPNSPSLLPPTPPTSLYRTHSRGVSDLGDGSVSLGAVVREDERSWESPEVKELMEKARARARMGVGGGGLR
ncbi:hypothetical protein L208DRAFT_1405737 [Tricholoma matsutake]|nr:hypothetical protein L208DRAFT_1405737 [Tricholoma matsutake 945]